MRGPTPPVVLVDDEPAILLSCRALLRAAGVENIFTLERGEDLLPLLREEGTGVVVLDLVLPGQSGAATLAAVREEDPDTSVIILTGRDEIETAVECMRAGAFDYLVKPVEASRFTASVRRALEIETLRREVSVLKRRMLAGGVENEEAFSAIVTADQRMFGVFSYLEAVAPTGQPILISGETGAGKELAARAVHALSGLAGNFIPVNAAGLDESVFADTLFGHRKGAFTGADSHREGMISRAAGGTLFLDEIGDLSPAGQIKLLRLIEDREYFPLGSDTARLCQARIVVATNRDLARAMEEGHFRRDLYYRLGTHQVMIPPLRERKGDLPLLLQHFLAKSAAAMGKKAPLYPPELIKSLALYSFPGNVRELENLVCDAVAKHRRGTLSLEGFRGLPGKAALAEPPPAAPGEEEGEKEFFSGALPTLKEAEGILIAAAMKRAEGNQGIAAQLLGISRQALNKRLSRAAKDS